ncbi:MAG: prepilin-type N-terminal cleavage/methylation domain-containing protein [Rhizonema sp. NSF051]|nr:prepilin-type N-terminal cleavage/methylation domain-containing protein [Rhizonema sp. NSF051]
MNVLLNIRKTSSNGGYTLLEILVVIVLIGILSAIAIPSWLAFIDTLRLNTAQHEIYRAIRQAQSEAIKSKLTWQASFREQNSVIQWAVHPADAAGLFIPNAVQANNNLWHTLEPNIHIDQQPNSLGKNETTIRKQTSFGPWRVLFNYQGCPIYNVGNECTHTSLRTLGQINLSSQNGGTARRCVYISTIIGAMRMGKDHDAVNENGKFCY